jgi:DNA-binding winged helix-turn-helix (wHTH) protein/TolB-like protein/Tfp pilus assembly protein PilF
MNKEVQKIYEFEDFRLDTVQGLLFRGGSIVNLTPKAVEILRILVEDAGQLVAKEELMKRVWADSFVEEANLSHHIFKLRKALGETDDHKIIETVPKRGYRFVGGLAHAESQIAPGGRPKRVPWRAVSAAAVLLSILSAAGWFLYSRQIVAVKPAAPKADEIRSIAVMPFINESGSEEIEYLSDGMTETLINSLAQIPSLGVKSRSAVFRFKGQNLDAPTLGSELNVQAILNGRLTLRGNDITLFLSLIDTQSENQVWGKQYVRKLSDLVALQSEIGRDVAQSLEARLTSADESRLSKNYSKNAEAYRLYLLGDYFWAKFTGENFWKAKKHYEEAIAIDPNYALAYTGLANTYSVLGVNGHMPAAEARPKSKEAAERAIQLDPNLAEAHLSVGAYKMFFEWDLDGAENAFKRAMELDPAYAVPHELNAYALRARGRHDEAIVEAKRAIEFDPLHLLILADLGVCYRFAGRIEEAIEINNQVIERDPSFADVRVESGLTYAQAGNYELALQEGKKGLDLTGNSAHAKASLGVIYARAGDHVNAKKVIDELVATLRNTYVSPMDIALIYSAMKDRDNAIIWLEKALQERSPWMFELNVTPELDPIRDDPRFHDLARRVGLPEN